MSTNQSTAASSPSVLTVLELLLKHDPSLLTTRELGRLSICSKDLAVACEDGWKALFEKCAESGKNYLNISPNRSWSSWNDENCLLECFSNPTVQVLARVGYKRAAGCLLGKTCVHCGRMVGRANPLTMQRICKGCSHANPAQCITGKSRAKSAFLLTDKDLQDLPSASFSSVNIISKKPCTCVTYLLSDIKAAAYTKYNGADGLANEIAARETKAMGRYNRSQSTDKPQKKRPRIAGMCRRPGDDKNLKSHLFYLDGFLPVGTAIYKSRSYEEPTGAFKGITFSVCCRHVGCDCMGSNDDILAHERLEHDNDKVNLPDDAPRDICPVIRVPGVSSSLAQWFSKAECLYKRSEGPSVYEDAFEVMTVYKRDSNCIIRGHGGVTFEVLRWEETSECSYGKLTIQGQRGSGFVPVKLLELGVGESGGPSFVASHDKLIDFMLAVGCDSAAASPAELLVMVLSRAMSLYDAKDDVGSSIPLFTMEKIEHKSGIIKAMYDILKLATGGAVLPPQMIMQLQKKLVKLTTMWAEEEQLMGNQIYHWHIMSNKMVKTVASQCPTTLEELKVLGALEERMFKDYGERLIKNILFFVKTKGLESLF